MIKIGILGAGISGLSIAKMLRPDFDVEVLEKECAIGGIAKTRNIEGTAYHLTGGHCFNSKYPEVLAFVFDSVLPKQNWNLIQRNAKILLNNYEVSYPIEYAIPEIAVHDKTLAEEIVTDFLSEKEIEQPVNMEDWFRKNFGNKLTDIYFKPYNEKIWRKKLEDMVADWIPGKMPVPSKESFLQSLTSNASDHMPHQNFYYPKSNNQNTFIENLAEGTKVTTNYCVEKIVRCEQKWHINEEKCYDLLINTLPLNLLPSMIADCPESVLNEAKRLKYNKITTSIFQTKHTDKTWTYVPNPNKIAHRYIHIGNFFRPCTNFTIVEATGIHNFEDMIADVMGDPFFIKPLAHHVSDHAYVVYDNNRQEAMFAIKDYLSRIGLHTLGRFGEWDYYNMDVCIKKSLDLAKLIKNHVIEKECGE